MCYNFVCTFLCQNKSLFDSFNWMSSIGISRHILIDALNTNLQPCASIGKKIRKMSFATEIWPCLNSNTDTFGLTLFWELNSLFVIGWYVATKSIMQILNEEISVLFIERHKGTTHDNKFNLVYIMSNFLKLFNPISCLDIWIVSGSYCSHRCRLISCIRLSRVFEVWIRASRAIDTYVSSCCDMRATMWLTHDSYHSYSTRSSDRLGLEQRRQLMLVVLRQCADDFY